MNARHPVSQLVRPHALLATRVAKVQNRQEKRSFYKQRCESLLIMRSKKESFFRDTSI